MPIKELSSGIHRKDENGRTSSLSNEFRRLVQETIENSQIPPTQSISNVTESSVNSSCAVTENDNADPDTVKEKAQNLTLAEQIKMVERQWPFMRDNGDSDKYMFHASQETSRTLVALQHLGLKCAAQRRCCERSRFRKMGFTPNKLYRPPIPKVVTLTMELNGHEFPHLIASGNKWSNFLINNIHRIHEELPGVKIEFADHVDLKDVFPDTFNQTRIIGSMEEVSKVRLRMIQLSPMVICVPIYDFAILEKHSFTILDEWLNGPLAKFKRLEFFFSNSYDEYVRGVFNFTSGFRLLYPGDAEVNEYFLIKGVLSDTDLINEAALSLRNLIYGKLKKGRVVNFASSMEVPVSLDSWLCCGIAEAISASSHAKIVCTSMTDEDMVHGNQVSRTYYIGGQPVPVVEALMDFYSAMPLRLTFDCEEPDLHVSPTLFSKNRSIDCYDLEKMILTEFRRSPYELDKICAEETMRIRVSITTSHENVDALFERYYKLLGINRGSPTSKNENLLFAKYTRSTLMNLLRLNTKLQGLSDDYLKGAIESKNCMMAMTNLPNSIASSYKGCHNEAHPGIRYFPFYPRKLFVPMSSYVPCKVECVPKPPPWRPVQRPQALKSAATTTTSKESAFSSSANPTHKRMWSDVARPKSEDLTEKGCHVERSQSAVNHAEYYRASNMCLGVNYFM